MILPVFAGKVKRILSRAAPLNKATHAHHPAGVIQKKRGFEV